MDLCNLSGLKKVTRSDIESQMNVHSSIEACQCHKNTGYPPDTRKDIKWVDKVI